MNAFPNFADYLRSEADWYVWDVPQRARDVSDYFSVLVENGSLSGCARYCLTPAGEMRFRADIPRMTASDLVDIDEIDADCQVADDSEALSKRILGCLLSDCQADAQGNVARLCMDSGWPYTERSNGRAAVELETHAGVVSALVAPLPNGLEVSVDLLSMDKGDAVAPQCLEAIGLFMLRLAGAVRMVRPVARLLDDRTVVQLCVHVPQGSSGWHLSHAFAACSVAADVSRAECRALMQPAVAGIYVMTN